MARRRSSNDSEETDSLLEDWGDYMNAKKSKLEKQFLRQSEDVDVKCNIFHGTSIFVNGYTVPTADEMRILMMEYGGIYHHYYRTERTTYMIASNLPASKVKYYKNSNVKIIKPEWVTDSIREGKMMDFRLYLLLSDSDTNQNKLTFVKKCNDVEASSSKNLPSTSMVSASVKTANDEHFLEEFYNNSRLHHVSTMGSTFKQYINELRAKDVVVFAGREKLKNSIAIAKSHSNNTIFNSGTLTLDRCIMHIDMDCFFVSVGLKKYPHLKGHPVVVTHAKGNRVSTPSNAEGRKVEFSLHKKRYAEKCGKKAWFDDISETDSMAEIACCSYEARKMGIKNGMLLGQALKLCAHLRPIPYDFEGYKEVSYALYNHLASYTLDIEAVSCDEMYVDCTELLEYTKSTPMEFATHLRSEIKEITGCPCSTGFGSNRLIARLATKKAKPDGQYHVVTEHAKKFMTNFSVSDLPGVGSAVTGKLRNLGVVSCKELQEVPINQLQQEFGIKSGLTLHKQSLGEDDRPLNFCHKRKSVSAEVNYGIRFQSSFQAETFIRKLAEEVEGRLKAINSRGKTIIVKLMIKHVDAPDECAKFLGHGYCNSVTKSVTLLEATSCSDVIYRETLKMIQHLKINPSEMRGIGIQMTKLEDKKIATTASGKMDKFVVRSVRKKNTSSEESHPTLLENSSPTNGIERSTSRVFDEAEYDLSYSQVDPDFLSALPDGIRSELETQLKRKSKRSKLPDIVNDNNPNNYIIFVNGQPRINPYVNPVEVVKGIGQWMVTEKQPQPCDVTIIWHYLEELIKDRLITSVSYIMNNFDTLVVNNGDQAKWREVYTTINKNIRFALNIT